MGAKGFSFGTGTGRPAIQRVYPQFRNILSADRASAKDVERARELDLQLCQGCHTDRVGAEKILPAYRLKEMAAGMPSDEFLARLLSGVRGTSDTALANPLSLGDIRGLLRLYQEDAVD